MKNYWLLIMFLINFSAFSNQEMDGKQEAMNADARKDILARINQLISTDLKLKVILSNKTAKRLPFLFLC